MPKLSDLLKTKKIPGPPASLSEALRAGGNAVSASKGAGAVIRDGRNKDPVDRRNINLPPVSRPPAPGPRQLDTTKPDSESVPMEFAEKGTSEALFFEVLAGFHTERCLFIDQHSVWLCVRCGKTKRVVVFHEIPNRDPVAELLRQSLPVLNPNGELVPEANIKRVSK